MTMKMTYSWIIYSFLILGTGILCDGKLERRPAVSSCSENNDDNFFCTNGPCIEWHLVCDGHTDCSDGSDETKELCAQYDFGTNTNMKCGNDNGNKSVVETPWLVYIHKIDTINKKIFIMAVGAIIAPNVVVSMVQTYWRNDLKYMQNSKNDGNRNWYSVSHANKYYMNDTNHSSIDAKMVYFVEDFDLSINYNADILAVIVLENNILFRDVVSPVCIDWYNKYSVLDKAQVEIYSLIKFKDSGFDNHKKYSNGNYTFHIDNSSCQHLYDTYNFVDSMTFDKFCIRKIAEKNEDVIYEYQHLYIYHSNFVFLTGLKSFWSTLNNNTAIGFIDIKYYVPWIRGILNKHNTVDSCILPTVEGVVYSYKGSNTTLSPGTLINHDVTVVENCEIGYHKAYPRSYRICLGKGRWLSNSDKLCFTNACILPAVEGVVYTCEDSNEILPHGTLVNHTLTVIENCEVGYHKTYPNGFRICQRNGKWKTVSEKLCLKMCPPLISDSLDIKCTLNGKYANCSNPSIPDTIASPSCKPTHTLPNGQEETPIDILCQSNGIWNNQLYKCQPFCGKVYIKSQQLINNGENAPFGTAPWNVAIYQHNKNNSNYDFKCGGSIINHNLVVSVAHCFWEKGMVSNTILVNDGLYKIAVGKYSRDFTIIDNQFTKIINVEIVYLKESYNGLTGHLAEDIAIIVLKNSISFNDGVTPVCIDWNGKYNVVNGDQGKIVGWGKTEENILSPILLEASLPYLSNGFCRNMFTNGFESFVTPDKFCAGSASVSGQRMDKGDSGAGLCFLHSNLYYLIGVVSSRDPETNSSIAVFTELKYHIQWIRNLFIKYT